jgi:single-stranded-DNA-specific exonuclease
MPLLFLTQNETIALIMMNCGCGIGFKLIQVGSHQNQTTEDLIPYLDLVSAAIAADIVPMTGENRVLAYFGLQVINSNPRPGIKAIIHQIKKKVLDITDVVFYYRTE